MGLLFGILLIFCTVMFSIGILMAYGGYRIKKRESVRGKKGYKGIVIAIIGWGLTVISLIAIVWILYLAVCMVREWPY